VKTRARPSRAAGCPAGAAQGPGPNDWCDSTANVRVQGSDLLLSIVRDPSGNWTSSEIGNQQHLGYGTYRWVVATDLSRLDADDVLGMFTYGGSDRSNNEIDIEASHWGDMSAPAGWATVWQDADVGLSAACAFSYSNRPPYVNQFTWSPGLIDYMVTDGAGATLFAWTVRTGVPRRPLRSRSSTTGGSTTSRRAASAPSGSRASPGLRPASVLPL